MLLLLLQICCCCCCSRFFVATSRRFKVVRNCLCRLRHSILLILSQESLPAGATLVPVIGMSDQTHLTNFSGDKKAWPVYLTIGNIRSKTRNCPSKMAIILVALLPVPPKFASKKAKIRSTQRMTNDEILEGVFSLILEPLGAIAKFGKEMNCSDGMVRQCFLVLAAWIADQAENETLHGLKRMSCVVCEVPVERLGSNAGEVYPTRDYEKYTAIAQK